MNIYDVKTMGARIAGNPYVGRGIAIGRSADGAKAVFAYFIMGRSVNSRNRVLSRQQTASAPRPLTPPSWPIRP